jgi:hypothetical protein
MILYEYKNIPVGYDLETMKLSVKSGKDGTGAIGDEISKNRKKKKKKKVQLGFNWA